MRLGSAEGSAPRWWERRPATAGRIEILIGGRVFRTKGEAEEHVRAVRDKYGPGANVTDADDQEFLMDLLALHPEAADKIGPGVDRFEVRRNEGTVGFWIVRTDGTARDFSFVKCLRRPSYAEEVRGAMREAVRDQKFAFRDGLFAKGDVRCPVTNEALSVATCHIHHQGREFVEIADAFAEDVGGYERIAIVPADSGIGRRLSSDEVRRDWEEFHRTNADLVAVSIRANLSELRHGRRR